MPKQITLEEILKELKTQFIWNYTDLGQELGFVDEVIANPQDLIDFITTYFTEFARQMEDVRLCETDKVLIAKVIKFALYGTDKK